MGLKAFSIALGILAGTAGVTNSGIGIYQKMVVTPGRNEAYNRAILEKTPLLVETVEIRPDPTMVTRTEVTIKVFPNGDILVESGARRRFLPLRLDTAPVSYSSLLSLAFAGESNETVVDGVVYQVDTVRYIESMELIGDDQMRRIRKFSDGTIETSVIDMRTNMVKDTLTEKIKLTDAERLEIEKSPYKKTIFTKKE
jgi:hypothetical protein